MRTHLVDKLGDFCACSCIWIKQWAVLYYRDYNCSSERPSAKEKIVCLKICLCIMTANHQNQRCTLQTQTNLYMQVALAYNLFIC